MKATKIIAVLAVALVAGTMGLTSCSKGNGGSGKASKVKGELLPEGNFSVQLTKDESGVAITGYDMKDWKKDDKGKYVKKDVTIPSTIQGLPVKEILGVGDLKEAISGIVIPEGVEIIHHSAFYRSKLASVSLPSTLKIIGSGAFSTSTDLTSCSLLPEGLEYIGESAFESTKLTSVTLPKSLRILGKMAFVCCDELVEINIPEGLEVISTYGEDYDDNRLSFTHIFSGDKIDKSLALQKLLKETKAKQYDFKEELWKTSREALYAQYGYEVDVYDAVK